MEGKLLDYRLLEIDLLTSKGEDGKRREIPESDRLKAVKICSDSKNQFFKVI